MSDRGIPTADGAPACPFVAFDDDRDARSTAPDHRHRCFAEPVPAPRAIAHQDAYCLSPAFAVCPAFQDWARREAAAARPGAQAAASAPRRREEDTSGPVPMAPAEREPLHAPASVSQPASTRKPPARDWAAPPPWVAEADTPGASEASAAPGAIPGWGAAAAAGAAAGAAASRSRDQEDWGEASRGLADSAAARLAGPDPDLPAPARPTSSWAATADDDDIEEDEGHEVVSAPARPPEAAPVATRSAPPPSRPVPPPRAPSSRSGARPAPSKDPDELFGPAWERPRRYEAYPSLRTRVGLPSFGGVPRLAIAAGALVIAAAFLFFVSPMILGLGGKSHSTPTAEPSSAASAAPTDTPVPTVPPAPTPFTYTIVKGDTLSAIAARYGVTVKAILKANPQIKNQNSIKEGDQITIPAPPAAAPSGVSGASPSAVSGASSGP